MSLKCQWILYSRCCFPLSFLFSAMPFLILSGELCVDVWGEWKGELEGDDTWEGEGEEEEGEEGEKDEWIGIEIEIEGGRWEDWEEALFEVLFKECDAVEEEERWDDWALVCAILLCVRLTLVTTPTKGWEKNV